MVNVTVSFILDGESPPEPTGPADWVTLVWMCFCIASMLTLFIMSKLREERFFPLRTITSYEFCTLLVCGSIDMFAIFIANEQLESLRDFRRLDCPLWSYWLQYPLGIAPLFIMLSKRILYRTYNFHTKLSLMSPTKKRLIHNWIVAVISASIIGLCLWITVTEASHFDTERQTCVTRYSEKVALCVWVFILTSSIWMTCILLQSGIGKRYMPEWTLVKNMVMLASCIFILNLIINTLGLLRYSVGRSIFGISRGFLYLGCMILLVGKNLFMSFRMYDHSYTKMLLNSYHAYNIKINSIKELSESNKLMNEFIEFCNEKTPKNITDVTNKTMMRKIDPQILSQCYNRIQLWTSNVMLKTTKDDSLAEANAILKLLDDIIPYEDIETLDKLIFSFQNESLGSVEQTKAIFDNAKSHIIYYFQEGWGNEYLSMRNTNMLESRYVEEGDSDDVVALSSEKYYRLKDSSVINKLVGASGAYGNMFDDSVIMDDL